MTAQVLAENPIRAARTLAVRSPAKVNLTLDILGRRGDGYHDLRSLVIGVDLCDHVRCIPNSDSAIEVECSDPKLGGAANLAHQAATALAESRHIEQGARISIRKRIPIGGGLGGGSGNAAAALRLCNDLWGTNLTNRELAGLGQTIGSDVSLFYSLPSAVIEGRGERVRRVRLRWSGWVLLICPGIPVSTAEVYRAWRREDSRFDPAGRIDAILDATRASEINPLLDNQLESAAFRVYPALTELRDTLSDLQGGPSRMSGSGSTMYRLYDDPTAARRAALSIRDRIPRVKTYVAAAPVGMSSVFSEES